MNMKLFDYQEEMVGRIGRAFGKHQSIMVQMPTGTGKTYLLAAVVKSEERRVKNLTALQRELKYLGLWKFAGAVMYVLHEALGLPEAKMIAPIDMNEGRFLLAEIMQGGNFGQYDTRLGSKENEGKLHRYLRMSLRNLRFVKHYPTEALSEPLFRTWFAVWKKIHGIR